MRVWDPRRWRRNADGTHTRRQVQDEGDLSQLTKPELQELLKAQGLPTSGNKADLVARLEVAAEQYYQQISE